MSRQIFHAKLQIKRVCALLFLGFALSHSALAATSSVALAVLSKKCARSGSSNSQVAFPDLSEVTVYGDVRARSGIKKDYIEAAAVKWNKACQEMDHVPRFVIDWEHDRPSSENSEEQREIDRTSLLVIYSPDDEGDPDPQKGTRSVASWSPFDNTIKIFGKCSKENKRHIPCEKARNSIIWESSWGSIAIAHEFGHALGLVDDPPECDGDGLMRAIVNKEDSLSVLPEYCRLTNVLNNEHLPCHEVKRNSDTHPCYDFWLSEESN